MRENDKNQTRKNETIAERHRRQKEDDGLSVVIIVLKQKKDIDNLIENGKNDSE